MKRIEFTKMEGLGNDYIYVDTNRFPIAHPETLAMDWSRYHTGIGADGLVLIGRSDKADFSMRIFNADGSEAMMCGNASRCIGKYVFDKGLTCKQEITLETLSGIKVLSLEVKNQEVMNVTVDMGVPLLSNIEQVATHDGTLDNIIIDTPFGNFQSTFVCMGNPHTVIFVDDVSSIDIASIGESIERHPLFPKRTNVEFVQQMEDGNLRMRVWERGSGITQACGTGACAIAVAACITGRSGCETTVYMDGGALHVKFDHNRVWMKGPAKTVFEGKIEINDNEK
jgi:diaminopimelate epimerase